MVDGHLSDCRCIYIYIQINVWFTCWPFRSIGVWMHGSDSRLAFCSDTKFRRSPKKRRNRGRVKLGFISIHIGIHMCSIRYASLSESDTFAIGNGIWLFGSSPPEQVLSDGSVDFPDELLLRSDRLVLQLKTLMSRPSTGPFCREHIPAPRNA